MILFQSRQGRHRCRKPGQKVFQVPAGAASSSRRSPRLCQMGGDVGAVGDAGKSDDASLRNWAKVGCSLWRLRPLFKGNIPLVISDPFLTRFRFDPFSFSPPGAGAPSGGPPALLFVTGAASFKTKLENGLAPEAMGNYGCCKHGRLHGNQTAVALTN